MTKFISKENLAVAWEQGIKPEIERKQDKLPEGNVGQVLTVGEDGLEWSEGDISSQLEDYATKTELEQAKSDVKGEVADDIASKADKRELENYLGKEENAVSASKLNTSVNIWGQSFDGSKDVSGNLSNVGTSVTAADGRSYMWYTPNGETGFGDSNVSHLVLVRGANVGIQTAPGKYALYANGSNNRVGLGTNTPAYNVDIIGTTRASGEIISSSGNAFRAAGGNKGFIIQNVGDVTFFLLTNSGDPYGDFNNLRPLYINNSSGAVTMGHNVTVEGRLIFPRSVSKATTSGALSLDADAYDTHIITLNGNVSGITLSKMPKIGQDVTCILYGNGTDRTIVVANSGVYKTNTGSNLEITASANGYAEINFLYDGTNIWVRGV